MGLQGRASEPLGALVELASGIDALYMSGRGSISSALLADISVAKQRAQDQEQAVPFDLGGVTALVAPGGFGRYTYRIETPHGLIGLTTSRSLPPIRVQPLAEHLHAVGPMASLAWFGGVVGSFTSDLYLSVSRVDVFSDWHGLELRAKDRHRFVGRATRVDTHESAGALTGLEFGRRTTKTIVARIYDKSADMKRKGSLWWREKWGAAYDPARQVMRLEFEFGRKGLQQYGVDSARQAIASAPALYRAATADWLSLRVPTADQTKSRWPVDPVWTRVQSASFAAESVGLDRVLEGRVAGSLRAIMPGLNGYLASFCALTDCADVGRGPGGDARICRWLRTGVPSPFRRPRRREASEVQAGVSPPNYARVAQVMVRVGLRLVAETERGSHADGGVLPRVDGGASRRRVLD